MANGATPFERALERSTPGFNSLLQTIQGETDRLERNRQLAQQRKRKEDLMELQRQHEISIYEATTGKQQALNRQLKKDLAELEQEQQQQELIAEAVDEAQAASEEAADELAEEKRQVREDIQERWINTFQTMKLDEGFNFIPRPDFIVTDAGENLQGLYRLDNGETLTPDEYNERYGWVREAKEYINKYDELRENDRISRNSNSEVIGIKKLRDTFGRPVSIKGEDVTKEVTKKYLSKNEAIEKLNKMRRGDREVLRKFRQGIYDFNEVTETQRDIGPSMRTDIQNIQEFINSEVTVGEETGATVGGIGITDILFDPGFTGDLLADLMSGTLKTEQIKGSLSVQNISTYLEENADETTLGHWNRLKQNWGKLEESVKRPWSELVVNPVFTEDTPLSKFFVSVEEARNLLNQQKPKKNNDFELTEENIRLKQSQGLLNNALRFNITETDTTQ